MKKLFANDKFFLVVFLVTIISLFAIIVLKAVQYGGDFINFDWLLVVIYFVCELTMFISYKNHDKNVMKGMLGATLMAMILDGLFATTIVTTSGAVACTVLYAIVAILMFIAHFIINSDHHSNPGGIKANIVFCIIFAIINVVWFFISTGEWGFQFLLLFILLANIGVATTVVCIEAKLDTSRINREAAGWTEDKGYPEGYVHDSDKKQK